MTTEQLDHLRAIDAHLDALLALAAKRTPGEWGARSGGEFLKNINAGDQVICTVAMRRGAANLPFIAACAGRAEAGWRATKAAIAAILEIYSDPGVVPDATCVRLAVATLAAWPRELLTLP